VPKVWRQRLAGGGLLSVLTYGNGYRIASVNGLGTIDKCPHCDATDIPRVVRHQLTCGKLNCRDKQKTVTAARRRRALK